MKDQTVYNGLISTFIVQGKKSDIFLVQTKFFVKMWHNSYVTVQSFQKLCTCKNLNTGQPRYVKLAYLEYTAYAEVIIHSRSFPLYCFAFQTCLYRTWLSRNLGYSEVLFHSRK